MADGQTHWGLGRPSASHCYTDKGCAYLTGSFHEGLRVLRLKYLSMTRYQVTDQMPHSDDRAAADELNVKTTLTRDLIKAVELGAIQSGGRGYRAGP